MNHYIGHPSQLSGVEEHVLTEGKGKGMRLLEVRNGLGLAFSVSQDRCADISRLWFKGDNYAYISPCGYVGPEYYDHKGIGFLKSFTAGFLTTCGLNNVGAPMEDGGEHLPLHGTIGNTPADHVWYEEDATKIVVHAKINQMTLFSDKLVMDRKIICSKTSNQVTIEDAVVNEGDKTSDLMLLYHFNMGYPLLSETSELTITSSKILARDEYAAEDMDNWARVTPPEAGINEKCYYHYFEGKEAIVNLYNPSIKKGLEIKYDTETLDHFVEWKMMGVKDYVLGLEPANCLPDGKVLMREKGILKTIAPKETKTFRVILGFYEGE